jgi:hypothetical protein
MKKLLLLAIIVLMSLTQTNAAPATKFCELEGGRARNILQDYSGNIYANTQTALYKYSDSENKWQKILNLDASQTQGNILTTNDNNGNSAIVFYSIPQGGAAPPTFIISTDAGSTWNDITFSFSMSDIYNLQIFQGFNGEFIVNFGQNGGFYSYVSTDNCSTFTKIEEQNSKIEFYSKEFVIRKLGNYLQKQSGDDWKDIIEYEENRTDFGISENYIYALDGKKFYSSDDGGDTWSDNSTGLDFEETDFLGFLFTAPNDQVLLYVMSIPNTGVLFNYIYKFDHTSNTWTKIYDTGEELINGLPICALQDGTVLTTTNNGVIRSNATYDEWTAFGSGLSGIVATQVLLTNNDKIMYVDGNNTLYICDIDGKNRMLSSYYDVTQPAQLYRIFKAKDGNIIVSNQLGIYVSTDNGDTWTLTSNGITGVMKESPSKNLYFASQNIIYKSVDGGLNWAEYYDNVDPLVTFAVTETDDLIVSDANTLSRVDTEMNKTTILEEGGTYPYYHQDAGIILLNFISQGIASVRKSDVVGTEFKEVIPQLQIPRNTPFALDFASNGDYLISSGQGYLTIKALEDTLSYEPIEGCYYISNFFAIDEDNALLLDVYGTIYKKDFITGVIEVVSDNQENLFFPNPVTDEIHFLTDSQESNLIIFDNSGKKVYSTQLNGNNSHANLSNLRSGVYFFSLEQSGKVKAGKFIKK